jgi:hypothetical protein
MMWRRLRAVIAFCAMLVCGVVLGAGLAASWFYGWPAPWNWNALGTIATLLAVATALLPIWRAERRRRRQAYTVRFRLWMHFLTLRWLLTHLDEHASNEPFFGRDTGAEELHAIDLLLTQAVLLEPDQHDWVIFAMNALVRYKGLPIASVAAQAAQLVWIVDATLARLGTTPSTGSAQRPPAQREDPGQGKR